jgi:hypothetical protein
MEHELGRSAFFALAFSARTCWLWGRRDSGGNPREQLVILPDGVVATFSQAAFGPHECRGWGCF